MGHDAHGLTHFLKPVFHSRISPPLAKNFASEKINQFSFGTSATGQTEYENFQRLDQQNKFLQRRMIVKNDFYVKIFRRRGEMMEWKTAFIETRHASKN